MDAYVTWLLERPNQPLVGYDFLESIDLEEEPLPDGVLQSDGRIVVGRLIESLQMEVEIRGLRPLVAVTSRDLVLPGVESLYGYADEESGICLVSAARISSDPERFRERLENVIRHELGHLEGLKHCHRRGCLMTPVSSLEQIDERSGEACPSCLSRGKGMPLSYQRVLATLMLVLIFAVLNLSATVFDSPRQAPFDLAVSEEGNAAEIAFNGQPFWNFDSCEVEPELGDMLNHLFREIDPAPVTVSETENGGVTLSAGGDALLSLGSERAVEAADRLARQLNIFFASKGSEASACAACHLERKPEVLEAAYGRKWAFDRWKGFCP